MSIADRAPFDAWHHAGLECAIHDSKIGFFNGYVRLPDEHPMRSRGYNQLNRVIQVHGGLTYGPDEFGWVGFDTGHSGDIWPTLPTGRAHIATEWNREWTMALLRDEVNSLAEQMAPLQSLPDPSDRWEADDDEFDLLLHEARCWRRLKSMRGAA